MLLNQNHNLIEYSNDAIEQSQDGDIMADPGHICMVTMDTNHQLSKSRL